MILAVDAGNSRIKWGLHDGGNWLAQGNVAHGEIPSLATAWHELPHFTSIIISNVAGEPVRTALLAQLEGFGRPHWVVARREQCGVKNGYGRPEQLGSDRWAALIAAWHLYRSACLVVNAGTALTADALSDDGVFLGGIIVPGPALLREALAGKTAGIGPEAGEFRRFPANTADAVHSGALQALAGAVERMAVELENSVRRPPRVLLTGGAAHLLPGLLNRPVRLGDNLVLQGLIHIALQGSAT